MQRTEGLFDFVRIGEVAETTTQLLSLNLQYNATMGGRNEGRRSAGVGLIEQMVLQQARDYLAEVKDGFTISVRTTEVANRAELRFLLDRVLLDWAALSAELGLDEFEAIQPTNLAEPVELERVRNQLLAFGMAVTALGCLPRLPSEQVTFPFSFGQPPTYSDISAPSTAGELYWRIEELEKTVWQLMSDDMQVMVNHRYGPLRRTYGFFETSAHLARHDSERFGVKKPQKKLDLF